MMKYLKQCATIILLLATILVITGCDGTPSANTWPLSAPDNSYEIDAWGSNPDLLEFTPKGNSDYFCVLAVSGSDDLKTMFCMPKKANG
jgi:hypothetical protein